MAAKSTLAELKQSKLEVLLKEYELVNAKIEKFVGNQFLYTQGALALAAGYVFFLVEGIGNEKITAEQMKLSSSILW